MNKITVVGIGPGAHEHLTLRAERALREAEVIVGYRVYIDLIKEYYPGKEFLWTGMRQEEERCKMAFEEAEKGRNVVMVCSGDAGVYGMAGLLYEMGEKYPDITLEIVPGVTAALAGGALLGAPLGHDFAVISLSDLLTPLELIWDRVIAAAKGDFCICIYNPSGKTRKDYLKTACEKMLIYKSPDTVCGVVRNIAREGEWMRLCTLAELKEMETDMFTTVFVGNRQTKIVDGKMVTPRGYRIED